jgi:hypothetical protein
MSNIQALVKTVLSLGILATAVPSQALQLYVSPSPIANANCQNTANACSLLEAQRQVRTALQSGPQTADIKVTLASGTYRLTSTFSLTRQDSGKDGYKVIYEAQSTGSVLISGGIKLNPTLPNGSPRWSLHHQARNIWVADISDLANVVGFRQLYVDGVRATRARTPNANAASPYFLSTESIPFTVKNVDLASIDLQDVAAAEVVYSSHWLHLRGRISSFDAGSDQTRVQFKTPEIDSPTMNCKGNGWQRAARYYFENAFSMLDAPGEWYLDRTSPRKLYYIPQNGQAMNSVEVILPQLETLFAVGSEAEPAHDIVLRGMKFLHSNWDAPSDKGYVDAPQAALQFEMERLPHVPCHCDDTPCAAPTRILVPGAVLVRFSTNVVVENNHFQNTGAHALLMSGILTNNKVRYNTFTDLSAGGIYEVSRGLGNDSIQSTSTGSEIYWNQVTNVGRDYTGAVGILATTPHNMKIWHNEVYYAPFSVLAWDGSGNSSTSARTTTPSVTTVLLRQCSTMTTAVASIPWAG